MKWINIIWTSTFKLEMGWGGSGDQGVSRAWDRWLPKVPSTIINRSPTFWYTPNFMYCTCVHVSTISNYQQGLKSTSKSLSSVATPKSNPPSLFFWRHTYRFFGWNPKTQVPKVVIIIFWTFCDAPFFSKVSTERSALLKALQRVPKVPASNMRIRKSDIFVGQASVRADEDNGRHAQEAERSPVPDFL